MKKMMTAALWAGMMAQVAAQILLWNRVKILEREPKEGKPEESPAFLEPESWEKLWAKGLEGIMSYGMADARGERRYDE